MKKKKKKKTGMIKSVTIFKIVILFHLQRDLGLQ